MADAFPSRHSTTTSVTNDAGIYFDESYLLTIQGKLKLAEILVSVIAFFFISFSIYNVYATGSFFCTVAALAFWWSSILLVLHLFHVVEKFHRVPIMKIEAVSCGIFASLYLLASIFALGLLTHSHVFLFASICGFICVALYGYDCYLKLQDMRITQQSPTGRTIHIEINKPAEYYPPRY